MLFSPVGRGLLAAGSAPLEALAVEWGSKVARYSPFTETLLRPNPKVRERPLERRPAALHPSAEPRL